MFLANMAKDHIAVSLDSEQTWKDFVNIKKAEERFRYVRLNTTFPTHPPQLDDLSKLKELRDMANKQFAGQYETNLVALKLVASSFYFQPDEADSLKKKDVTGRFKNLLLTTSADGVLPGYIRCRLPDDDPRISALGKFIFEKAGVANEACFVVSEQGKPGSHTAVKLDTEILKRMIHSREFQLKQIKIHVSNEIFKTYIELRLAADQSSPISGFPRCLIPYTRRSKGR
jgi:hypothetical protein